MITSCRKKVGNTYSEVYMWLLDIQLIYNSHHSHLYVAGGFLKTDLPLRGFTLLSRALRVVGESSSISLLALFTGLPPGLNSPVTGHIALRPLPPLRPLGPELQRTAESDFHVLTRILRDWQVLVIANIAVAGYCSSLQNQRTFRYLQGIQFVSFMGKFSYFYVIPSCQSLSGDPINIHCLFGNFSTDVFSQLPFLRQMTWQLLELLIQSHLVKLLSNLPLRPLSELVRVGLADPVSPVALSKQESHRGGLWQSDGTEWSGGDKYSTNKGGINNKNEKNHLFSWRLPKSYQPILWSADPGRDASFSAEFVSDSGEI